VGAGLSGRAWLADPVRPPGGPVPGAAPWRAGGPDRWPVRLPGRRGAKRPARCRRPACVSRVGSGYRQDPTRRNQPARASDSAVSACMPYTARPGERRCSEPSPLVRARAQLPARHRCCPLLSPASCPRHALRAPLGYESFQCRSLGSSPAPKSARLPGPWLLPHRQPSRPVPDGAGESREHPGSGVARWEAPARYTAEISRSGDDLCRPGRSREDRTHCPAGASSAPRTWSSQS
jgi:hypothetical protein